MNDIQLSWNKARKPLKLIWRHVFTLYIITFIVRAIFAGHVSLMRSCVLLCIAAFFDRIKMQGRNTNSLDYRSDEALHVRERNNPTIPGTPAHHISTMGGNVRYD